MKLNHQIKSNVLGLAGVLGGNRLAQHLQKRKLRILCYHGVWLGPGHYGNHLFVSAKLFAERLEDIRRCGLTVISLDEGIDSLVRGKVPGNSVVITIDDGWYGTYKHMLPALRAAKMPATIYAYTQPMVNRNPVFNVLLNYLFSCAPKKDLRLGEVVGGSDQRYNLTSPRERETAVSIMCDNIMQSMAGGEPWQALISRLAKTIDCDIDSIIKDRIFDLMTIEELTRAAQAGFSVQLHTQNHYLDCDNPAQVEAEIAANRDVLGSVTNERLRHFCYPSGIYSPVVFEVLNRLDIVSATTTKNGLADSTTSALELPRIVDGQQVSAQEFRAELSGLLELTRQPFAR